MKIKRFELYVRTLDGPICAGRSNNKSYLIRVGDDRDEKYNGILSWYIYDNKNKKQYETWRLHDD